ncbi:hypothetical protein P152DRAFT_457509 [Eremomyces bilateralis CBS 781.70]|uniref:Uncharacterized protein n=1 Tax=Eremomyces bilateralis CBS 781.70 TaxID=1392243 RepID=A0A6G1G571_9PEZI|nr:uncharacterized protein P152DRAFT_457509 [Eremomyces bilateralis CBS 781.70]KAF1813152.1 hypothetical protein P152DRAFT_457509 [Eremomyces bilateralis CBS 781.70]
MPRLVRRAPLMERLQAYLNPWDFLLWLLEELNSNDWDEHQKRWALPIGVVLNLVFMVAKANSSNGGRDDVFGEYDSGGGLGAWLCEFLVLVLVVFSAANAFYTFYRRRHYRLFENPINEIPATPSAQRVRVDSSPVSSPLRFLSNIIGPTTAQGRAHPDPEKEVWQVAVWDPTPICLRLFCLFSPGHVLVYYLFLPTTPLDPRPSVTVFTTMLLSGLLSTQLTLVRVFFAEQSKDSAFIHKAVMNEYDLKFVRPNLNRPVRDVGIQTPDRSGDEPERKKGQARSEVDTYTPTTIINRGFHIHPNPAYAQQYDPDHVLKGRSERQNAPRPLATPVLRTPMNGYMHPTGTSTQTSTYSTGPDFSSPIRPPPNPRAQPILQSFQPLHPSPRKAHDGGGEGGSLGVYTHAASPLRKAASANYLRNANEHTGRGDARTGRERSPFKRMSTPSALSRLGGGDEGRRESGRF